MPPSRPTSGTKRRYVYDPLYGRIHLPIYVWRVLGTPEVQRLREVRLCNTSSLTLTGAAGVSRFEHSIGTAYLAMRWVRSQGLSADDAKARQFVLAALLHDVGSAAFGHAVQYTLQDEGFEHESVDDIVSGAESSFGYRRLQTQEIYLGMPRGLPNVLSEDELREIGRLVRGQGIWGGLINGSIDLDNIDNVFRLAFHLGIYRRSDAPIRLAEGLGIRSSELSGSPGSWSGLASGVRLDVGCMSYFC